MNRRDAVVALVALGVAPFAAEAQQAGKVWRIGFLSMRWPPTLSSPNPDLDAFVQGMQALGYIEGKNLVTEWRYAGGRNEVLPGLAAELVKLHLDVIVSQATPPSQALQRATSTIPIVILSVGDPVAVGLVTSLARPGGNITGTSNMASDVDRKLIELVRDLIPALSHAAIICNLSNPAIAIILKNLQIAAKQLGVAILQIDARTSEDIERGFERMKQERIEVVIVPQDPFLFGHRSQIAQLAVKHRLPMAFQSRLWIDSMAGGLLSYGSNLLDLYRRGAVYVDKIFKGAKPGDLPVEQPTTFELIINLKTAKALGIKIPQTMLLRADKVIE